MNRVITLYVPPCTVKTFFSDFGSFFLIQVNLVQVDNDDDTVTEWSGEFWQLSLNDHAKILALQEKDDPDVACLYASLRRQPARSRGRGPRASAKAESDGRGNVMPYPTLEVSVNARIPVDAVQADVFHLVRSRRDTPGFAIKSTYHTMDWMLFVNVFAGWPFIESVGEGFWDTAVTGDGGRFVRTVRLDFPDNRLDAWCHFARFLPANSNRIGQGAAIFKPSSNTSRFVLSMDATYTFDLRHPPGRQSTVITRLWIANYGPFNNWRATGAPNKTYFGEEDYEKLKKDCIKKMAALFPTCALLPGDPGALDEANNSDLDATIIPDDSTPANLPVSWCGHW